MVVKPKRSVPPWIPLIFLLGLGMSLGLRLDTWGPDPVPVDPVPPSEGETLDPRPEETPEPAFPIPIVMYHQVDEPPRGLTVTPGDFAKQMDALKDAGYVTLDMDTVLEAMGSGKSLPEKTVVLTFDDGYDCFYRNARPVLKERGFTATVFVITGMVGKKGYLTWEQIEQLCSEGYTLGCHTHAHPDLRLLTGERLVKEVADSREILRERTGQEILSFSYPAGEHNDTVIQAVKSAGFSGAVTTEPGIARFADDPYTLKRIRVDGRESLATFKKKLSLP